MTEEGRLLYRRMMGKTCANCGYSWGKHRARDGACPLYHSIDPRIITDFSRDMRFAERKEQPK